MSYRKIVAKDTTYLNVKGGVETHSEMAFFVLFEQTVEALLEDRCCERIRDHHDTIRVVRQRLHLQQADLVQAPSKQVDSMPVLARPLRQSFVELDTR